MKKWISILYITFLGVMVLHGQNAGTIQDMLKNAKQKSFNQQWGKAAEIYSRILKTYPSSSYTEEIIFWLAFCHEKQAKNEKAFNLFARLVQEFPDSPWSDDAAQHQILIAERLYEQNVFKTFLYEKLRHQDPEIRLQAALALGRKGDKRALPVLKLNRKQDEQAKALLQTLQTDNYSEEQTLPSGRRSIRDRIVIFPENRFEQYKQLVKNKNTWSRHELVLFGMWHILSEEAFDSLYQKPEKVQKEHIEMYWKYHDPTLTTLKNEAKQEFNVRLLQAHQRFSYFDNLEEFYYAPWDARGELLIKYGPPENRIPVKDGEIWEYNNIDQISFFVRLSVTNIFGRGIFIHKYRGMNLNDIEKSSTSIKQLYHEFILTPRFDFHLERHYDLADIKLDEEQPSENGVNISYSFPVNQMAWVKINNQIHIQYDEHFVVYNENWEKISDQSMPCQVSKLNESEMEKLGSVHNIITLPLQAGEYTIGLRVTDKHSDKVGIARREISVRP